MFAPGILIQVQPVGEISFAFGSGWKDLMAGMFPRRPSLNLLVFLQVMSS